jgi:hypothetical protein
MGFRPIGFRLVRYSTEWPYSNFPQDFNPKYIHIITICGAWSLAPGAKELIYYILGEEKWKTTK